MEELKRAAGEEAARLVGEGMIVGLGTGSTMHHAIRALGKRVDEGLRMVGIPTSIETQNLARQCGIPLSNLNDHPNVNLSIDGADEVDPQLNLIKGMGGALVREKIVASASKEFVVVVDESKLVRSLGEKSPLPVEVLPFGWSMVEKKLEEKFDCKPSLRKREGTPFVTDNGNYILDLKFERIENPRELDRELNHIPGIIENGLFLQMASLAIVAKKSGVERLTSEQGA